MPRARSGRSGRPRSRASRSPPPKPVKNTPPPAPAPASNGGSARGSLGSAIADGFSFGAGHAMGHRFMEAIFGPRTIRHEVVPQPASPAPAPVSSSVDDGCGNHSKAFQDCLNNYGSDINKCQVYIDMLNECRRNSGSVMGA